MKLVVAKRLLKSGITNFFRNIWVSIAATSMVTITLFIISTMIILYTLTVIAIQNSTDKVGVVTAYFNEQTTEAEIENVRQEIEAMQGVKSVKYTSHEEAKRNFEEAHRNQPILLETVNEFEDNEKPVPASLAVKADDLDYYPEIYDSLISDRYTPYFQSVRDNQKVINNLHSIINFITSFGILLAGIFMVVTVMVTFNTLRLTIYNRREEVEIMRLVGATNWYIRWPFFIEGIMYGIFATMVTSGVVFGLLYFLSDKIENFLQISNLGSSLINALFWKISLVNIVASIFLSLIASWIAMRRYLKI